MSRHPVSRRASLLIAWAATAAATLATPWAQAQPSASTAPLAWPTKPLKIIVGFPAGSSPDLTARTLREFGELLEEARQSRP